MDFIVTDPDPLLDAFFDTFRSLWSRPNQVEGFRAYILGLVSEAHRKNVQALSAKTVGEPYQSLHHFLTDAPWDADALNDRRLETLMADRRTAPRQSGILIVDDTGVPKKGHATEGVKRQYIGQLGKTANGQVFVTTHYADPRCHWPVDLAPYIPDTWLPQGKADPDFHTKIDLALDLVEQAVARGVPFRAVVADSWYGRNMGFLKTLEQRGRPYVVELQPSQRVFVRLAGDLGRNEHRLAEALSLLAPKDFRPVGLKMADGTEREVHVARLGLKIKRLSGKRRVVVVTTRPDDPAADEDLRFLTTNLVQLRDATVAQLYARRNWVEVFYREAKDDLGAGQYQVRDLASIVRHWMLVFVAYTLLVLLKREGRLGRWCKKNSIPSARPSGPCATTSGRPSSSTGCPTTENLSKNTCCSKGSSLNPR